MILNAPNGKTVSFAPTTTSVQVAQYTVDLANHQVTLVYQPPAGGGQGKVVNVPIPAGLLNAIGAHCQSAIEANEGWTAGSASIGAQ